MSFYELSEEQLREAGLREEQIKGILSMQKENMEPNESKETLPVPVEGNVVQMHHNIEVSVKDDKPLVPTTVDQLTSYKDGTIVELPPFAEGQPFVARMTRPSMLALVKSGKIPNSLLNQATSLFANGADALNSSGKNATNVSELFDVIDKIVEAALIEPTLKDIRSAGLELTDDQLMAIFSYTQRGIKALEQFRTE